MDKNQIRRKSKALSWLLRHGGIREGLNFDENGYTNIDKLLESEPMHRCNMTLESLKEIVANNDKKRFQFSEDGLSIRATQGHSMKFKMNYQKIELGDIKYAIHGTYKKFWDFIKREGLKTMGRTHIHFSKGMHPDYKELCEELQEYIDPTMISGMRKDCNVFIFLDIDKCLANGVELLLSENGVVLTSGIDGVVPLEYFEKVLLRTGEKLEL